MYIHIISNADGLFVTYYMTGQSSRQGGRPTTVPQLSWLQPKPDYESRRGSKPRRTDWL